MKKILISLQSSLLAKTLFWLTCLTISTLSLTPIQMLTGPIFDWWDKAQHASAFFALTCLGLFAYSKKLWPVILGLLLYGIAIEVVQSFTGWRFGELSDFLADLTGVSLGALLMWQAEKWLSKSL